MSIEENEGSAVRGLLGTAFAGAEPPLRDLASGSIARGDAAQRRNRLFAAGGAVLSAVAVIGTFAMATGTSPDRRKSPANQATSEASASPSGYLGFGPEVGGIAKIQDIRRQSPGLLQPLLPAGITVGPMPAAGDLLSVGRTTTLLSGSTGTNQATMWVGTAPKNEPDIRQVACPVKGTACQTRKVDGGTVYLDEGTGTAGDEVVHGAALPKDVLKPGADKDPVSKTLVMTFVPNDRTKYAFNLTVLTQTAHIRYADQAPEDYLKNAYGAWPPTLVNGVSAYDPSGLLVTADDLVAMLSKPGLDKLEHLLDPRTEVSQDTRKTIAGTEAQIVAAAEAALPSGAKVGVDDSSLQPRMIVTGPTGKNGLSWESDPQTALYRQQTLGWCPPNVTCTKRTVPGGTLMVWSQKPTDSNLTPLSSTPSIYNYWFLPDDTTEPALAMTLQTSAEQTGSPGQSEPDPGHTYSVSDGPYAPAQVSADQFLAAAQDGQLATAISKTKPLLTGLQ